MVGTLERKDEVELRFSEMMEAGEYLFVGMLEEHIIDRILLSPGDKIENLILIESRGISDDVKEKLVEKGVIIMKSRPLGTLSKKLLSYRKGKVVLIQPYRKLKLYFSLMPFSDLSFVSGGKIEQLGFLKVITDEAIRAYKRVRRYVSLGLKRIKLKKIKVYPYEIGFPNDYTLIERALKKMPTTPHIPVSIIIPVYNRKEELARTLSGLTLQDYPHALMEIVVADDGSNVRYDEIIDRYSRWMEIKYVWQEDRGYRLAAVRNLGIQKASKDVLILLDCDMIPSPSFVSAHMKWFHVCSSNLVIVGDREFIDAEDLDPSVIREDFPNWISPRKAVAPESIRDENNPYQDWRGPYFERTESLKKSLAPYNYASGGNVSFKKSFAKEAGFFDEEFTFWGGEDTEFFYRMYRTGAYIVPEKRARAYHQNHPDSSGRGEGRERGLETLEKKIPSRRKSGGGNGNIPKISIYMPSYNAKIFIKDAIESVIAQTYEDWELCICDDGSTDGTYEYVIGEYGDHEKIRIERISHSGIGAASNHAVKMCRGELIGQLDSDDRLKRDAIITMVEFLETHPEYGLAYSDYEFIDERGDFLSAGYSWPAYDPMLLLETMIVHPFRVFRTLYWFRTQGFNTEMKNAVDYDMYLKLSEVTDFFHIEKNLYQYRQHGGNTSLQDRYAQTENHVKAVKDALSRRKLSWKFTVDHDKNKRVRFG